MSLCICHFAGMDDFASGFQETMVAPIIPLIIPPTCIQVGIYYLSSMLRNSGMRHFKLSIAWIGPPFPVLKALVIAAVPSRERTPDA